MFCMRGTDRQQADMYRYLSPEERVRASHPLRALRALADEALKNMSKRFDAMYAKTGRPSIPPEKLLRAQLIQMLYSVRSERLLMEEIDYSVLFRWFVGMNLDEPVWDVTVFTKNRNRLLEGDVARGFKQPVAICQCVSAVRCAADSRCSGALTICSTAPISPSRSLSESRRTASSSTSQCKVSRSRTGVLASSSLIRRRVDFIAVASGADETSGSGSEAAPTRGRPHP